MFRRVFSLVDRAGRSWENLTIGSYNTVNRPGRELGEVRDLLAAVVAAWPPDAPPTPALDAARDYLRRSAPDAP